MADRVDSGGGKMGHLEAILQLFPAQFMLILEQLFASSTLTGYRFWIIVFVAQDDR